MKHAFDEEFLCKDAVDKKLTELIAMDSFTVVACYDRERVSQRMRA